MLSAESSFPRERMDFRQLQRVEIRELCFFVALAEELHFGRAAQRVGVTQSPLSKAITELEYRMRVRLFHRTRKRTLLTPEGAALLPHARTVLRCADRVRKDAAAFASGRKGRLRIGISDGLSASRVGALLDRSAQDDPEVELALEPSSLVAQLQALRSNELDVALAPSTSADPTGGDLELSSVALSKAEMVVALKASHVLAEPAVVRSLEAGTGPYLLVGDRDLEADGIEALIDPEGAGSDVLIYMPSVDALLTAVCAGRGVGLLSVEQVQSKAINDLVFRPLGLSRARVTTHLIKRRDDPSVALARFVERAQRLV